MFPIILPATASKGENRTEGSESNPMYTFFDGNPIKHNGTYFRYAKDYAVTYVVSRLNIHCSLQYQNLKPGKVEIYNLMHMEQILIKPYFILTFPHFTKVILLLIVIGEQKISRSPILKPPSNLAKYQILWGIPQICSLPMSL